METIGKTIFIVFVNLSILALCAILLIVFSTPQHRRNENDLRKESNIVNNDNMQD